jgi:hypothetical protein
MADHIEYLNTMRMILGTSSVISSHKNIITVNRLKVYLLEMEDVLFHLNSAVMMPKAPGGKSAADGTEDDNVDTGDKTTKENQEKTSGLDTLGLLFKQFEFDPNKRMIVAGHTDTSGQPKDNFELSGLRAENVLYLLTGQKTEWAKICAAQHKVEDYQQILKFFAPAKEPKWDPGKIDNTWGTNTEKATKKFLTDSLASPDPVINAIVSDSKKRWPEEAWYPVYDLYMEYLRKILDCKNDAELNQRRTQLQFVKKSMPCVACGESFPIDDKEKKNYRSQQNRRVEILLFDKDEIDPDAIKCPEARATVHKEEECPLWRKLYFLPLYIDPKDLTAVVYHLKFVYYDRVKNTMLPVPEGLTITAYKDDTATIPTFSTYRDGVYCVKVQLTGKETAAEMREMHFRFEAPTKYVYTKDKNAGTKPVMKSINDIKKDTGKELKDMPFDERLHYYDLPEKWSSKKYWTRYDGDINKGDSFGKVIDNHLHLKPFGDKNTDSSKPLVFSLDDIVLVKADYSPIHWINTYRFTVFDLLFHIHNADPSKNFLTKGTVTANLFLDSIVGNTPRVMAVNGKFYDITDKRSMKGDIIGARAGVLEDGDWHVPSGDLKEPFTKGAGNLELHYFSGCLDSSGKPVSVVLMYWSCIYQKGTGITDNDVNNFIKFGMNNAKNRWEMKNYTIEPHEDPDNKSITVIPKYFLEAREGNPFKCVVTVNPPGGRASMGLTTANFKKVDYQPRGTASNEYGKGYARFTMAHEVGHAVGLDDEYLESIEKDDEWNPVLAQFDSGYEQYYPGMPYSYDGLSMMEANKAPRLRHLWFYAQWLNEKNEVKKLTHNTKFKVKYSAGKNFEYFLKPAYKNYYKTAYSQKDATNGTAGRFDLFLYKTGNDESMEYAIPGQSDFDGILVVRIRMKCYFTKGIIASWSEDEKLDRLRKFQKSINRAFNKKFYLSCPRETDFKKVYIYFVPHYEFENRSEPGNFKITFEASVTSVSSRDPDYFKAGFSNNEFTVDEYTGDVSIMRYMLGLSPYKINKGIFSNSKESIETIKANDLLFLGTWVAANRKKGHNYTVRT